ncbi:5-formyltetrahydrofolate cyclo-ligase [Candidatus Halobeggiatoa sp. HSG11]|nr:5-formyltetrahydrofolate cyclo-ligase [Candidatus Halobeggiatoa sp. HSG11]
MTKNQLRQQFLSTNLDKTKNIAIKNRFFTSFDLDKIQKLHVFLPMSREINTWLIINEIFQNYPSISVITSKSNLQTYTMESYYLDMNTELTKNSWGISEPVNAHKCHDDKIDMILLPLLAFDKQGFRVGYGKGFYDRFLLKCRPDIIKIGLSQFAPIDKIDDINEYDIKMDFCVMAEHTWIFNN